MSAPDEAILCLDVGEVRIGVARANVVAKIAGPLTTLANNETIMPRLKSLAEEQKAKLIVVGLPLNRDDEDTQQTKFVRDFTDRLEQEVGVKVEFQNEADSSKRAKEALSSRGKDFPKEAIDAEAATLILQDYIEEQL